jgi:hypothetical protein
MEPFVSATCEGERCHCGKPAAKKVGEEIPFDDPAPARHSLTAYVCADHYAELMGPVGAKQVGASIPTPEASEQLQGAERVVLNDRIKQLRVERKRYFDVEGDGVDELLIAIQDHFDREAASPNPSSSEQNALREALKEAREAVGIYGYAGVRGRRVRQHWAAELLAKIDAALTASPKGQDHE